MKRLLACASSVALFLCVATCVQAADTLAGAAQYRTGALDPHVRQVPSDVECGVFVDPNQYLQPLVRVLIDGARDDFHKVKRLHDWIAENIAYDVESYFAGTQSGSTVDAALGGRRAVCFGYASLYNRMCTAADITCADISGYGRGYGFLSGRSVDVSEINHAWNAVQIDGHWYLVDVTWDAGYVDGRSFRKEYRTTYLFMDPRSFVFTHLPSDSRWQLLQQPLANDQFSRLPYLLGPFFDHGLRLLTRLERVSSAGRSVQFSVHVPAGSELMAKLTDADGDTLPQRTLIQHDDGDCKVYVVFPAAGTWTVQVFARPYGSTETSPWQPSWIFRPATGRPGRSFPGHTTPTERSRGVWTDRCICRWHWNTAGLSRPFARRPRCQSGGRRRAVAEASR